MIFLDLDLQIRHIDPNSLFLFHHLSIISIGWVQFLTTHSGSFSFHSSPTSGLDGFVSPFHL